MLRRLACGGAEGEGKGRRGGSGALKLESCCRTRQVAPVLFLLTSTRGLPRRRFSSSLLLRHEWIPVRRRAPSTVAGGPVVPPAALRAHSRSRRSPLTCRPNARWSEQPRHFAGRDRLSAHALLRPVRCGQEDAHHVHPPRALRSGRRKGKRWPNSLAQSARPAVRPARARLPRGAGVGDEPRRQIGRSLGRCEVRRLGNSAVSFGLRMDARAAVLPSRLVRRVQRVHGGRSERARVLTSRYAPHRSGSSSGNFRPPAGRNSRSTSFRATTTSSSLRGSSSCVSSCNFLTRALQRCRQLRPSGRTGDSQGNCADAAG